MTIAIAGNRSAVGRGRRRGQPEIHLAGDLGNQGRAHRRGVRARPAGKARRPSRHQPGAAGRRSRASTPAGLARCHSCHRTRPGRHRSGPRGEDGAGGNGADPRRGLERHRQAIPCRGIPADLRGAVAYGGVARGGRGHRRDARLLADPAHGRPDTPSGRRGRPDRRGTIRPPDQTLRPATNSSGSRPNSTRWPASCRFRTSARNASAGSSAFSRRKWPSWSTASVTTACSTGGGSRWSWCSATCAASPPSRRAPSPKPSSACCANITTRSNGW